MESELGFGKFGIHALYLRLCSLRLSFSIFRLTRLPLICHDLLCRGFDRMRKDLFEILFILSMPKIAELLLVDFGVF